MPRPATIARRIAKDSSKGFKFSLDVKAWCERAKDRHDLIVQKLALDMFTRVLLRSPVDTGRFQGNWQVAINTIPRGTLSQTDKSGTATINKIRAASSQVKAGDIIWLVNNLPYAIRLEYGWSQQAPAGMVRLTVREFNQAIRKANAAAKREKP